MDYPTWEVLTELSVKGNVVAQMFLSRWDQVLPKGKGWVRSQKSESNVFKTDSLLNEIVKRMGLGDGAQESGTWRNWNFWRDRDLRVMEIAISGYKGIPYENGKYYGLTFSGGEKDIDYVEKGSDEPSSFVILGSNGSGKTTVYSAMELALLRETSIELKHLIDSEGEQAKFRHHMQDVMNPFYISVALKDHELIPQFTDGRHSLSGFDSFIRDNVDLTPFFCSESDLSVIECSGIGLREFLDDSIGLGELSNLSTRLDEIIHLVEERMLEIVQKTKTLDRDLTDKEKETQELYGHIRTFAAEVKGSIEQKINDVKSVIFPQAQLILTTLLKDYEDEKVELSYDEVAIDKGGKVVKYFNGELRYREDETRLNPRYYFNNFRFKLYLVSLKVAIAFYIMNTRKIAFPLIFDDIFDSSDFTRRRSSKEYFYKIFKVYHDLEILEGTPLQIIYFTQDEVIAESVFDGICDLRKDPVGRNGNDEYYPERKVRLVRLFPHSECKSSDIFMFYEGSHDGRTLPVYNLTCKVRESNNAKCF